jgi:hypothetical protein
MSANDNLTVRQKLTFKRFCKIGINGCIEADLNPHDVQLGDIYVDLDAGRVPRNLKVMEIEKDVAVVLNTKTERMSRVRLDRLSPKSNNSHGYRLVERANTKATMAQFCKDVEQAAKGGA